MKRVNKDAMPSNELRALVRARKMAGRSGLLVDPDRAAQLLQRPVRRAARGLPKIGGRVVGLVRPLIRGSGASVAELTMRWPELAGARLARVCKPEKLSRSRAGTVLVLVARGGAGAALVELESQALLARINAAFGRDFVASLRIRQGRIGPGRGHGRNRGKHPGSAGARR